MLQIFGTFISVILALRLLLFSWIRFLRPQSVLEFPNRIFRNVLGYYRIRAYSSPLSIAIGPSIFAPAPTTTLFPNVGWRSLFPTCPAKSNSMIKCTVITNNRRFPYDYPGSMVYKEVVPNFGGGVNFYTSENSCNIGQKSRQ